MSLLHSRQLRGHLQNALLRWFKQARRDLPWRNTSDPYYIWISEVMLQQTQVSTVIPFYLNFIKRFPTIGDLAAADLEEVLKSWEGLGYYARVRNLHRAARMVMERCGGKLPDEVEALRRLPGLGRYVAAAVASIAFGRPVAAVDGNVKRVLARLLAIGKPVNDPAAAEVFEEAAAELLYLEEPGAFNEAMMELGALICRPRKPLCTECPWRDDCRAHRLGRIAELPQRKKRRRIPTQQIAVGVVLRGERMLITRRAEAGLLGGLWEFPGGKISAGETSREACLREIREETGLQVEPVAYLTRVLHAYTHFKIEMDVHICRFLRGPVVLNGPVDHRWVRFNQLQSFAFPGANRKFLPALQRFLENGNSAGKV